MNRKSERRFFGVVLAALCLTFAYGLFYVTTPFRNRSPQVSQREEASNASAEPITINEVSPTGTASLSFAPTPVTAALNTTTNVTINLASPTNKVSGASLELVYDPAKLQVTNFARGTFLTNTILSPTQSAGKITAAFGVAPDSGGKSGNGQLATLTVKALVTGTHVLTFGAGSSVYSITPAGAPLPGNDLKTAPPLSVSARLVSDLNGSKKVDLEDYNLFVADFGKTGTIPANINGIGKVDLEDYNIFVADFGKTSL